jgi:hypothetical protein
MPKKPEEDRQFSIDPYSARPVDSRGRALPVNSHSEKALNVLCPEAQADGVPCFELGRDCETCEMAYRWYVTWVKSPRE